MFGIFAVKRNIKVKILYMYMQRYNSEYYVLRSTWIQTYFTIGEDFFQHFFGKLRTLLLFLLSNTQTNKNFLRAKLMLL